MVKEIYGGRVDAMLHLKDLATRCNVMVPVFSAVSANDLVPIEQPYRPTEVPLLLTPSELLSGVELCWTEIQEQLADLLRPLLPKLRSDFGLPVLKTSFVANCEFKHLSFAGVGSTAYGKSKEFNALVEACVKLLRDRYRGYSIYYRYAHPSASSVDIGILAMEFMPKQKLWGTVWGAKAGLVIECSRQNQDPVQTKIFMVSDNTWWYKLPEWLRSIRGLTELVHLMIDWSQTGYAEDYFEVEFCINEKGEFWLTQWRPIPERASILLDATIRRGPETLGITPFSDTIGFSGRLCFTEYLFTTINEISDRIANSENEIWVVPYKNQTSQDRGITLFQLLVAAHNQTGLRLPPLLVMHESSGIMGHLHTITVEDPCISTLVYISAQTILPWHHGDSITLRYVNGFPLLSENPRMFLSKYKFKD